MTPFQSALMLTTIALATTATASRQIDTSPKKSPIDEIVVEGREIPALATAYVDRLLPTSKNGQFGRFEDPICPRVIGLSDKAEKEVADRMAEVGKSVRVDVQRQPCAPNLILLVVPDKDAALDGLRKSRPEYIKGVSASMIERMKQSPNPYASWQLAELYSSDGMRIGRSDTRPSGNDGGEDSQNPEDGTFTDLKAARVRTTQVPSRLRANVKSHIQSAIVLVESRALANLDTRQLADFALMQAMVPPNHRNDQPPPSSILGVFATIPVSDHAPQSVTNADVAFLKSLRSVRSDTYASSQRNEIRKQMIDELRKASATRN